MKKFLLSLVALLGIASLVVADTTTPTTESGTVGVEVGSIWEIDVDGYAIDVVVATDPSDDQWYPMLESMNFGTVNMSASAIFSTLTGTEEVSDSNAWADVPHRAGGWYMEERVYVSNNEHPFRVDLAIDSPLLDYGCVVPPAYGTFGGFNQSTMHVTTGLMDDSSMNTGASTNHPANLLCNTATPVPHVEGYGAAAAVTVYRAAGIYSDAFLAWVALDFLPLDMPRNPDPAQGYANWSDGSVTWTLVAE